MTTAVIEIEEGVDFEVDHDVSNQCYLWYGLGRFSDESCDYAYRDRDDCKSDAVKTLAELSEDDEQ
jgi:hypothetical protein